VARRIFALPWVEAGSHTYSHPLDWETLAQTAAKAETGSRAMEWLDPARWLVVARVAERWSRPQAEEAKPTLRRGHTHLRSYELYPFHLDQEVGGSIRFLAKLLPPGKRVEILQWSGTAMEGEAVLRAVHDAGVRNINGGDTRFDPEFASYAWVAPLGRQAGKFRQVYSSASNENTYTNLWNERYFGFRYVMQTLRNTDCPLRIKPFNLYYHMYSGEKEPSLQAIKENMAAARAQELAPISASRYAAIADGFYSARITQTGERRWRIEHRDGLNTVRFDHADSESVDFANSAGVVGQRRYQGSLYVALDSAETAPAIALVRGRGPKGGWPYLIQSRWQVSKLRREPGSLAFEAQGFGLGEMEWQAVPGRRYEIQVSGRNGFWQKRYAMADRDGRLLFTAETAAMEPAEITLREAGLGQ
ncbi:MAG: hypothetical protein C5B51_13985, partial [Terriglobia bacterium]